MKLIEKELQTYCTLHWWNSGKKTLSYEGDLKGLLRENIVKYSVRKTTTEGIYKFTFSNPFGIKFVCNGLISDFTHLAKQFIQMELVRMGDKSSLYVSDCWRPNVTINH